MTFLNAGETSVNRASDVAGRESDKFRHACGRLLDRGMNSCHSRALQMDPGWVEIEQERRWNSHFGVSVEADIFELQHHLIDCLTPTAAHLRNSNRIEIRTNVEE